MSNEHPITPPLPPVEQLIKQCLTSRELAAKAFQAGADMELEACCEWLRSSLPGYDASYADYLRAARRPKPSSLKEQALAAQQRMWDGGVTHADWELIRRALEQLDD